MPKGYKRRGKDQTFEGIKHFTPPSLICHGVGFNVLKTVMDSSASVCVHAYISYYFLSFHCLHLLELSQMSSANSIAVSLEEEPVSSGKSFQPGIRTLEEHQQKVLVMLSTSHPLDHQGYYWPFSQCSWWCVRFSFLPHCPAMLDICQKDEFRRLTPLIDKHGIDLKR